MFGEKENEVFPISSMLDILIIRILQKLPIFHNCKSPTTAFSNTWVMKKELDSYSSSTKLNISYIHVFSDNSGWCLLAISVFFLNKQQKQLRDLITTNFPSQLSRMQHSDL